MPYVVTDGAAPLSSLGTAPGDLCTSGYLVFIDNKPVGNIGDHMPSIVDG